ncbi:tRNA (guanosine(46)-N7)-methyltransferase TrmB [[Clostridium] aminophilum]|uniref:tRNA (guanosine(46)-N7)-methyltransferase TrmB n=1 Tax=[Clostridium] aminophilum TaxID=1526 RepID=UPI0026ED437A|nr:tRNA (guanosine(46)-N7)-methyltransferase TrmB [[Clostridium] aminophilum]MDD6195863.1 tRNA (guanosine(46)-N7)-methyltransferase TrmB [[Clostridium] aminophilum]
MRLRHIPGAEERIAESCYVIHDPENHRDSWSDLFGTAAPLHIEIGMGKGRFIMDMARLHPDINYIGIERYPTVLLKAIEKMEADPLPNLRFICVDARLLTESFAPGEVNRIYLNFSDPWPKDRHAKRRLTSPDFMDVYRKILDPKGHLEFKTDNRGLFDYSVTSVPASGWNFTALTYDLHHSTMGIGNVMTEYEEKFSSRGNPICKMIAVPR